MKGLLDRVMRWIDDHRWARIAKRSVTGFVEHDLLQFAGSMAYFAVLSIFQLLVIGVVVMSFFIDEGEARDFVIEQVELTTPLEGELVGGIIDAVVESRGGISAFGFVFLAWGALGVFSALSKGIAVAFPGAPVRPFLKEKLLGLLLMGFTGALALASVAIGIVTGILLGVTADLTAGLPGGRLLVGLVGVVAPFALVFVAFLVLYRVVPNRPVTFAEAWPGALLATILWTILRVGFTFYTTSIARYDSAFGPISTGITLLVFLYFASVVVLLGAEVSRAVVVDDEREAAARERAAGPSVGSESGPVAAAETQAPARGRRGPRLSWLPLAAAAAVGLVIGRISKRDE